MFSCIAELFKHSLTRLNWTSRQHPYKPIQPPKSDKNPKWNMKWSKILKWINLFILFKLFGPPLTLFGITINVPFISCVSPRGSLYGMLVLSRFSHRGVKSSWKIVFKKKKRWHLCIWVNQKTLLISSLVMGYFFRKASMSDVFEALSETSKTIWSNWKWQLCPEHMALFSSLQGAGGMQIRPLPWPLSVSYILPSVLGAAFSPNTGIPSYLVSFWPPLYVTMF